MKIYRADRTALNILKFAIVAVSALLAILSYEFIPFHKLMLFICILCTVLGCVIAFIYIPMWFTQLQYHVSPGYITKKSGVFFKVEQTVKFSSIQYLNIITSPFSKITGLNFIILNVYGGKMLLLFLRHSDSREILKYIGDDYC